MKAKDKKRKITLKNIICFIFFVIIIFDIYIFYNTYFQKNEIYTVSGEDITKTMVSEEHIKISEENRVDIDNIIANNIGKVSSEEYRQEDVVLEYLTEYRSNSDLAVGESYVIQEGTQGTQRITYKKTYEDGKLVKEEQVSASVIKPAFNQVIEIGTNTNKLKYKVKVGDDVYVTSDEIIVYSDTDESSNKVTRLQQNTKLNVLRIEDNWYYISYKDVQGWVKREYTKYVQKEQDTQNVKTSNGGVTKLNFNMSLNKPSGLTLEQFKKILTDSKDKNKIFEQNAEYFYYIEQQYNINGVFVAAIGIHESAWGTSKIAKQKKNLFGYGAYDSNPYNGAYTFNEYSECIDLLARVLVKYYLNPKGTSIYNGETAVGTYYSSPTVSGVNNKYASDKNWANKVYSYMEYLYGKL